MARPPGLNKHQKAARRPGEVRVSREEVAELLALSQSPDAEDRLVAARFLCPCHVRGRVEAVWEALYRMMEDGDVRVRHAAWHTLEDGGLPTDEDTLKHLAGIYAREQDPKVRRFADSIVGATLRARQKEGERRQELLGRAAHRQLGRCDFCGRSGVPVESDFETPISGGGATRPALICPACRAKG